MRERRLKIITVIIAFLALVPLLLINSEMWDMVNCEIAYMVHDFTIIKDRLVELGLYMKYYTYPVVDFLNYWTGIPHKVFTNVLSVASILGIAYEVFRMLIERYGFKREVAYLGGWVIICFPVWHTLESSAVFVNIFCLWLFMIAMRLWYKNKLVALLFLVPSLQLFSLFAFSVGFIGSDFVMTVTKDNYKKKILVGFFLSLCLVIAYAVMSSLINLHGSTGNYNSFNFDRLQSFLNYGIMAAVFLVITFAVKRYIEDEAEREIFVRHMLSFLILAFFAGMAYWAVGRPMRFFAFGSFTARHTFLTCIPFALIVAIASSLMLKRFSLRVFKYSAAFLVVALVVLLHQGYSHKVAAVIFKDMITQCFTQMEEPPSGYVVIDVIGTEPPRHVQDYAMNMVMYKAYGKAAWIVNGFWRRHLVNKNTRQVMDKLYGGYTKEICQRSICFDKVGDAYTRYAFTPEGYHQEGRFWYWWYHLISDYSAFNPKLVKVESIP
jgi:hypothetical protein